MIPENYLEKVYAGFLGMNVGIRLGAPVEPTIWTYERIRDTYGDIRGYVKDYKNFAADDDVNGPVYFLRAMRDDAVDREPVPQDVANAWLNYAREGVGMFWWGGYGISTEHTAYLNLKHGIGAPQSGSKEQNGKVMAEQIGGQIFIDTWGLISPGNPQKAAQMGEAAARVSHDGEGVYGARFFCACIAQAFVSRDIRDTIQTGLSVIPETSAYRKVADAVIRFHEKHPKEEEFRACLQMLQDEWGYDKYTGVCHIIPNAGVCVLSMLYGAGNFARTVEIATMCGWDTDCNAGNVGTVLGVLNGIEGIPDHYRKPIQDGIILSGISGYLNNLDIPTYVKEVALLGYRVMGEEIPKELKTSICDGEIHFDFSLPGSTHNIRLSDPFFCSMWNSDEVTYKNHGTLKILMDRMSRGEQCRIYYKPFYSRSEFSDERYSPVLTPTVYSGQKVTIQIYADQWNGWDTPGAAPYVRTADDKKLLLQGYQKLNHQEWNEVTFEIPDTNGGLIDEVGIVLESYAVSKAKALGMIYIGAFDIVGKADYSIAMKRQKKEFGTITPFSVDHGAWEVEDGRLSCMCMEEAFAYAGNYYAKDYCVSTDVVPYNGENHMLLLRAQGAMRAYGAGLDENGTAAIYINQFGWRKLVQAPFDWKNGQTYTLEVKAEGNQISLDIDGKRIVFVQDDTYAYGMFGCGSLKAGRRSFGDFKVKGM